MQPEQFADGYSEPNRDVEPISVSVAVSHGQFNADGQRYRDQEPVVECHLDADTQSNPYADQVTERVIHGVTYTDTHRFAEPNT